MKQLLLHKNWFPGSFLGIVLSLLLSCIGWVLSPVTLQVSVLLLIVSSTAMFTHRTVLKGEIRECVIVILHCLPRSDSLDHFEIYRNPLMPEAKSLTTLKAVLRDMESEDLVTITRNSRPRNKDVWPYFPMRVLLTQKGHSAARDLAERS